MTTMVLADMLRESLWARSLTAAQMQRVEMSIVERRAEAGGYVCRKGEPALHWIGILDGLVKMAGLSATGKLTTFTGLPAGAWSDKTAMALCLADSLVASDGLDVGDPELLRESMATLSSTVVPSSLTPKPTPITRARSARSARSSGDRVCDSFAA
jgi:hypothetical protein